MRNLIVLFSILFIGVASAQSIRYGGVSITSFTSNGVEYKYYQNAETVSANRISFHRYENVNEEYVHAYGTNYINDNPGRNIPHIRLASVALEEYTDYVAVGGFNDAAITTFRNIEPFVRGNGVVQDISRFDFSLPASTPLADGAYETTSQILTINERTGEDVGDGWYGDSHRFLVSNGVATLWFYQGIHDGWQATSQTFPTSYISGDYPNVVGVVVNGIYATTFNFNQISSITAVTDYEVAVGTRALHGVTSRVGTVSITTVSGSIRESGGGLDYYFATPNTRLQLEPHPNEGWHFVNWRRATISEFYNGVVVSEDDPYTVTVDQNDLYLQAIFDRNEQWHRVEITRETYSDLCDLVNYENRVRANILQRQTDYSVWVPGTGASLDVSYQGWTLYTGDSNQPTFTTPVDRTGWVGVYYHVSVEQGSIFRMLRLENGVVREISQRLPADGTQLVVPGCN